jgi:uncharacterized protein (UPF0264 family)
LKLLVSVINQRDAGEAVEGGADIVDVKNPAEGALGANFPWRIREVRDVVPADLEVSATIGNLPYLPGTAALAALGAAVSGVDYIKAGLYGARSPSQGFEIMRSIRRAVEEITHKVKIIAVGYADYRELNCVSPFVLPEIAHKAEADGVMIDIDRKDGRGLFDYFKHAEVKGFVEAAHSFNLIAALAGSLGPDNVIAVDDVGADIFGVRRAVCCKVDGNTSLVERGLVEKLVSRIRSQ